MGGISHHDIDNGDVEIHSSELPVEYNSEYVTDKDTNQTKSIDDDEIYHLMDFFSFRT